MDLLERFRDFLPQIYSGILISHAWIYSSLSPCALSCPCSVKALGYPESLPVAIPAWFLREGGCRNEE